MANTIKILVDAVDQASAPVGTIADKFKALGSTAGIAGLAVGAGMAAFDAIGTSIGSAVGFLEGAVTAASNDEASMASLTTALKDNVVGWDGNSKAIEDVITSRLKLGFSDVEQQASLALLVAKTGDASKALEIERAAMDLARLKGIDLATATNAVSMGMSGSGKALKALGINVKDYATSTEILGAI